MIKTPRFFSRGFTLLELLVVISIISILIAMGSVAFSTAQRKGRDSKRSSDVQQMQKAFEQYYAQNGSYDTCAVMAGESMPAGLPTDPKPSHTAYNTATGCSTTTYCVCALLEETGSGNATAPTGTTCNFGSGDYVCATNLQ
jgi:type IV pilus assembly protein PilE